MLEGSSCPYKCGRGPSFSYPFKIPYLYRQLNRSYDEFHTIKTIHFYFSISSSTILRDTYRRMILSFHPKHPKSYANFTHREENRACPLLPGGVTQQSFRREAPPRGPTPYPFIYHF